MKYMLFENDEDCELEIDLPSKIIVCKRCRGKGTHTNPNIDGNGISPEEFIENPGFKEDYLSGVYDVLCSVCQGRNVLEVVDEDNIPEKYKARYEQTERWKYEIEVEDADHRRACEQGWGW